MAKTRGGTIDRKHISDFKLQLDIIDGRLTQLNKLINRAQLLWAEIYELPTVTKEEEKQRLLAQRKFLDGRVNEYVEPAFNVSAVTGNDALGKALRHFARYQAQVEDSTRYAKRLPGAVFIRSNEPQEILEEVTAINALKKELADIAKGLAGHVDERWEIIHNAIPGFISAAAYRTIPFVVQGDKLSSLYSVRFAYDHRTRNEPYTRKALLEKLGASLQYTDIALGMQLTIQSEIQRINEFEPSTEFVQRRNMPAVPICKVRGESETDGSSKLAKFVAHSPILFVNLEKPERYSELSDYPGRVLAPSSDTIIRRLHIFRK